MTVCLCDFVSHPNEMVPTAGWLSENNLIEENCYSFSEKVKATEIATSSPRIIEDDFETGCFSSINS